ncbi:hypothetical protein Micbo1qcDRAFT_194261 [Microdochium bolleyi]|uniref:CID domain-containing protein n=1 Tax=Microdochium bolleyi TaxID=196109 RepID=A0A136J740_9PEZI|nr:hypothetical protein Micbo1qcDRAFT_194261 [Microdochium bolleyi]
MAAPLLDIAKVSFSALLLRSDPVAQTRAEIDDFLRLLDTTISRCSPANVQKCKQWIVTNIAHSQARTAALLKYLTALARSFIRPLRESRLAREPSSRRKRLHILYVLNDALHHTHTRSRHEDFAIHVNAGLPDLFKLATSFAHCPRHIAKVNDLLKIWRAEGYISTTSYDKLSGVVLDASKTASTDDGPVGDAQGATPVTSKTAKNAPYLMPAMHGDATAAWYDLPAANWMPVIEPNSTRPMNPAMIKPLQFKPGPAETHLVDAVKALLADADRLYAKEHAIGEDDETETDQMGQPVVRDEVTGEIIDGQTYYGWSRGFCEKMKLRRKKNNKSQNGDHHRGRSSSQSRSRSPSRSSRSENSSASNQFHMPFHPPIPPPPFPPSPADFNSNFPGFPPRPPNYQGPWPPPPPPPLPQGGGNPQGRGGSGSYRGQNHRGGRGRGRGW